MQQIRRRTLLKGSAAPLVFAAAGASADDQTPARSEDAILPNMLGAYGRWAAEALPDPPRLSFRQPMFTDAGSWRPLARSRVSGKTDGAGRRGNSVPAVLQQTEFDGLSIEHLQWQLPFGPPTEALLLKPAGARGKLPGIVGLHDHGGQKFFGMRRLREQPEASIPS